MLKAYDYAERPMDNKLHEAGLFNKEKRLAMEYVLNHPLKNVSCPCSICGSLNNKFIFSRWDVNYYYCKACGSIYVPVDEATMSEYKRLPGLIEFMNSNEYQQQANEARNVAWDDFISWLSYRTYRYLGRNTGLKVLDYGNKYRGLVKKIRESELVGSYELDKSILDIDTDKTSDADLIVCLNQLQHETNPIGALSSLKERLSDDGVLVLSTRLGSGFDILTLKGGINDIFPYEHVTLPSKKGLEMILDAAGFSILEITTPGTRDMNVVLENKERIDDGNFFVKYLIQTADERTLQDFQQFLQKASLSSFAQVIAKKRVV